MIRYILTICFILAICVDDVSAKEAEAENFCQCEERVNKAAKTAIDKCYIEKINADSSDDYETKRRSASINCGVISLNPQFSVITNCDHLLVQTNVGLIAPCKDSGD